jgi:hypothetical protein
MEHRMSSINQTRINQLTRDLADLRKADAQEAKKEADLQSKLARANEAANKAKNTSVIQSKLKEMERASKDLASVQKKRADIARKMADRSKSLGNYQERQASEDDKARKKAAEEQKKLIREREAHEKRLTSEIRTRASLARAAVPNLGSEERHDFFISHASEDKEGFVRELAEALRAKGANVWYDEFTVKVGDSLRRTIDRGLANSTFGVVVFSENFFKKEWTNKELDGLVALETQGQTRILPIWHKVSKDEVARYSPSLADKVALNTSLKSISEIADNLMELLQ